MAGVYISYPFCGQKCTYCNFASGPPGAHQERDFVEALYAEIASVRWPWVPETVYLGGGTPSRLDSLALERILAGIPGRPWLEATLEAAPGEVTRERAEAWRRAGIDRVSLGVQSFVEKELRPTARRHNATTVEADVRTLREAGLTKINLDLIAGLPYQTRESWRTSLDWVRRLEPPHVSVYLFEIDEDSRLGLEILTGGARYGARHTPDEDLAVEFYEEAVDLLAAGGYDRYEISNFARPGHASRHNLKYWRLEPYLGFGSDAHSFDGGLRWQNVETAAEYVARWRARQSPRAAEPVAATPSERFWVGLRLAAGIRPTASEWRRWAAPIGRLTEAGLLERAGDSLRLTRRGVLLSNEVFQEFLPA